MLRLALVVFAAVLSAPGAEACRREVSAPEPQPLYWNALPATVGPSELVLEVEYLGPAHPPELQRGTSNPDGDLVVIGGCEGPVAAFRVLRVVVGQLTDPRILVSGYNIEWPTKPGATGYIVGEVTPWMKWSKGYTFDPPHVFYARTLAR
jgi:hypothetical protein